MTIFPAQSSLAKIDLEIDDDSVYAQACSWHGTMVCTVQDPVVFAAGAWNAKINGNPLPDAPTYNLNLSARYDFPRGRSGVGPCPRPAPAPLFSSY